MSDDGRVNFSLEVRGADGFNEVSRHGRRAGSAWSSELATAFWGRSAARGMNRPVSECHWQPARELG